MYREPENVSSRRAGPPGDYRRTVPAVAGDRHRSRIGRPLSRVRTRSSRLQRHHSGSTSHALVAASLQCGSRFRTGYTRRRARLAFRTRHQFTLKYAKQFNLTPGSVLACRRSACFVCERKTNHRSSRQATRFGRSTADVLARNASARGCGIAWGSMSFRMYANWAILPARTGPLRPRRLRGAFAGVPQSAGRLRGHSGNALVRT